MGGTFHALAVIAALASGSVAADKVHPGVWARLPAEPGAAKVWVYFADKGFASDAARSTAIADLERRYNRRAVLRRQRRGLSAQSGAPLFSARDLPVAHGYIEAVTATGAERCNESRWLNAVSVRATASQVSRIARLPFVRLIEPVRCVRRTEPVLPHRDPDAVVPGAIAGATAGSAAETFYGLSFAQLDLINLPALHAQGFTGDGVVIGVLDTGFHRAHEAFTNPDDPFDVIAEWDFINDDPNAGREEGDPVFNSPDGPLYQDSHGTWILGTMAAFMPGSMVGGAYDASFILCKTEDITQEVPAEEDNFVAGLEFIEANGGDIATSSLGYPAFYSYEELDGQTAVTTQAVNIATANGLICCTAAGNAGREGDRPTLIPPGDAFDVITVGAVDRTGALAGFSSAGPTADGRLKPEVLAVGQGATSVSDLDIDAYLTNLAGTSLSTPMVAAAVACILQKNPTWGVDEIRTNLFQTASIFRMTGTTDPAQTAGYGIIDAFTAAQDCNGNNVADWIDIRINRLPDEDGNGIPDVCEPTWDADGDGRIDLDDLRVFRDCLAGPEADPDPAYTTSGECLDLFDAGDGDVDLRDVAGFQTVFTGTAP